MFGGQVGGVFEVFDGFVSEILGVGTGSIEYTSDEKNRSVKVVNIAEVSIVGIEGLDGAIVCPWRDESCLDSGTRKFCSHREGCARRHLGKSNFGTWVSNMGWVIDCPENLTDPSRKIGIGIGIVKTVDDTVCPLITSKILLIKLIEDEKGDKNVTFFDRRFVHE